MAERGTSSMTEREQNVEPPYARRSTQVTLATIAVVLAGWAFLTNPRQELRPELGDRQDHRSDDAFLIEIDLNTSTTRELELLPGVGPILARRIVASREAYGQFQDVDELARVHGIGPKMLKEIRRMGYVNSARADRFASESLALPTAGRLGR